MISIWASLKYIVVWQRGGCKCNKPLLQEHGIQSVQYNITTLTYNREPVYFLAYFYKRRRDTGRVSERLNNNLSLNCGTGPTLLFL